MTEKNISDIVGEAPRTRKRDLLWSERRIAKQSPHLSEEDKRQTRKYDPLRRLVAEGENAPMSAKMARLNRMRRKRGEKPSREPKSFKFDQQGEMPIKARDWALWTGEKNK